MRTGLLLGAGASYDLGMPLVWELTAQLKRWLTPERLRKLNEGWRSQPGDSHPDRVIDALADALVRPDLHYESILGSLEVAFRRNSSDQKHYWGLYSWLVEVVYWHLYLRHVNNTSYIRRNLRYLEGIARLAEENQPLWIFSLNHDLMIECLAAERRIPLNCGFTDSRVALPRRDPRGAKRGDLQAQTITSAQFQSGLPFLQRGAPGINLLKIHGSLDVFAFREGKDLLKLVPFGKSSTGVIASLLAANEELRYPHPAAPKRKLKITNEIAYADDDGECQFLRRTLLAGAFKFDNRTSQVLPMRMLDHFRSGINYVNHLICIGYGFGDHHINDVVRRWLEFSAERSIEIVSPGSCAVPSPLLHVASQVTPVDATATDYLDRATGIVRPRAHALERRLASWMRSQAKASATNEKLGVLLERFRKKGLTDPLRKVGTLPQREGRVDLKALRLRREEFVGGWANELETSIEHGLEQFLDDEA